MNALQSLNTTVSTVLGSVGSVANTLTTGIDSINDWAIHARQNQRRNRALGKVTSNRQILATLAQEAADIEVGVAAYKEKSDAHRTAFDSAYEELEAALAAFEAPAQ
jgi:hypothetical protein